MTTLRLLARLLLGCVVGAVMSILLVALVVWESAHREHKEIEEL